MLVLRPSHRSHATSACAAEGTPVIDATATHPLATRPAYSDAARDVLAQLERRLDAVESRVFASDTWRVLTSAESDPRLVRALLREVMLSVHQYQPLTTEAGFTMLGRLPKQEAKLLSSLLAHKVEEAEHASWARRDVGLLGDGREPERAPCSPANFAVAAVWQRLATTEEPFGYLGAEYLFEALTMHLAPHAHEAALRHGVPASAIGFIVEHATEDVKHTNLVVHWILDIATRYPSSGEAMLRAFDYFAHVYPIPVWDEALDRARAAIR